MQNFVSNPWRYIAPLCLASLLVCSMAAHAKTIEEMEAEAIQHKQAQEKATADAAKQKAEQKAEARKQQQAAKEAAADAKRKAEEAKKPPPAPPKPVPVQTYVLTVKTEPASATVSIRNIQPKYRDGIQLAPGKYQIRVAASGYQTQEKWVELGKTNKTLTVALKKLPPLPEPAVVAPAPAPAPVAQPQASYQPATTSQNRVAGGYIDHGNGTITDTQTRLMWKKCSEGQSGNACSGEAATYKWDAAMSRFKGGVSFADYNDWRMPTREELRSLVYCSNGTPASVAWDNGCSNGGKAGDYQSPTINLQAFPNTSYWYWSSTPNDASLAWVVVFDDGYDFWSNRGSDNHVRLVRSGQ